ncbi:Electron transport complex subunit RsxC OS=Stutzerimonas stutzeri OX=316 GN=rsxC PE=4 SV=1 [Stutzerimonas stutzeri]
MSDEQKRLKIEASLAQVALKKAEKQLAAHATEELQAQVAELRQAAEAAQRALAAAVPPAAPQPAGDEALKKAKIEAAMLRAQIRKLEKTEALDDDQQAELARLRQQLHAAETALSAAASAPAKPAGDEALKKAKIEAAMLRAQIRKLEKVEAPDDDQQAELARLRQQLRAAETTLAAAENAAGDDSAKPAGNEALKKAKIELALKRAELKKAEQAGCADAKLARLRDALAAAEQALHAAEADSGKPAPVLLRTSKPGVDERLRELKTDVAFARADLRKLERDPASAAASLESARARLQAAEQRLTEHMDG